MAERRMFAKTIIDSDAFIDMPVTARLLYYDLSMRADDDGFVNSPKKIMRMIGASQDDLSILIMRKFIIPFDSGIVVIKHWRIHNYIRKDMYHETKYKEEKETLSLDENNAYTLHPRNESVTNLLQTCNEPVTSSSTEDRIGKDRIGKDRDSIDYISIIDLYHDKCPSLPTVRKVSDRRKRAIRARLRKYSIEEITEAFEKAEASDFLKGDNKNNWTADFDWIMNDSNLAKILDGKYENKAKPVSTSGTVKVPMPDYIEKQISGILPEHKKATQETLDAIKKMQSEMKW